MKSSLFFILFSLCPFLLLSQKKMQTEDLSEVRKNKYQVEIGLRSIKSIWDGTTGGTLLFKKQRTGGDLIEVNAMKLLRAYLSINTQVNFTDDPTLNADDTTNVAFHPGDVVNFSLGIGFEKQKKGKLFVHYSGMDFFGSYYRSNDDFQNGSFGGVTINSRGTTDRYVRVINAGISPFFGIKHYFTSHLSVGIETNLNLFWFNTKVTEVGFQTEFVNGFPQTEFGETAAVTSNGIRILYNGLRFITVGYTF